MLRTLRLCGPLALVFVLAACAEPPNKEMNQAQGAIDAARAAGAEQYAGAELSGAIDALRRSEEAVAQNDYRLALSLAIDSRERAQAAAKTAVENRAKARGDAERIVAEVNSALTQARTRISDTALAKLPRRIASDVRTGLATAEKTMQEARAALAQDDYARATSAAEAVSTQIQETLATFDKPAPAAPARRRR
jgi:paraquat-inducible protein B